MLVEVKKITRIEIVATDSSSSLYKEMVNLYNLVRKKTKKFVKALKVFSSKKIKYLRPTWW